MRCKEYVQAINSLHHYFEEMDFRTAADDRKLKKRFCYFPLNLAILHCFLGHKLVLSFFLSLNICKKHYLLGDIMYIHSVSVVRKLYMR